jgi:hypothetical protein
MDLRRCPGDRRRKIVVSPDVIAARRETGGRARSFYRLAPPLAEATSQSNGTNSGTASSSLEASRQRTENCGHLQHAGFRSIEDSHDDE